MVGNTYRFNQKNIDMELEAKKCDCGKGAKWLYMPGFANDSNPFVCEDCIMRGCSCNERNLNDDFEHAPTVEDGVEGVDWMWVEKDVTWCTLDSKGRKWPCAEYEYDTDEDNFKTI